MHLMGAVSGFIGTYLIGPRIGKFKSDMVMSYVLKDKYLEHDEANLVLNEVLRERHKNYMEEESFDSLPKISRPMFNNKSYRHLRKITSNRSNHLLYEDINKIRIIKTKKSKSHIFEDALNKLTPTKKRNIRKN